MRLNQEKKLKSRRQNRNPWGKMGFLEIGVGLFLSHSKGRIEIN